MADLHEVGQAVNDGERQVLRVLRDELGDNWTAVANFEISEGQRLLECDAVATSPNGWAYLIETKAWVGRIRGNDQQWELPSMVVPGSTFRPNPVNVTMQKNRILKDYLVKEDPLLKPLFVQPLVVVVSDIPLELVGKCADLTVLLGDLLRRLQEDPRPYRPKPGREGPPDMPHRVVEVLTRTARPIAPTNRLGPWDLDELLDAGPTWEVWSARIHAAGPQSQPLRVKRYRIDSLAVGPVADRQRERVRRDLETLNRLAGIDGAVPIVGAAEEFDDEFAIATPWPEGESIASILEGDPLSANDARDLFSALVAAVSSVHRSGVVHRNLSPRCAHLLADGRVMLTDFDYARLPDFTSSLTGVIQPELEGKYVAPEVRADAASASRASDVWSTARIGLSLFGAQTVDDLDVLPEHWRSTFVRALDSDPAVRIGDAELFAVELTAPAQESLVRELYAHDVLDQRFVVREHPVAEGGISRVYRVYDPVTDQDFAAKFVRPLYEGEIDAAYEFRLLREVPQHPFIVRPEMPVRINSISRGGKRIEWRADFAPTPWIDGTSLDRLVAERLPVARVLELGIDLSAALEHLHKHSVLHRDLKPQNVLILDDGTPRLVDFNVSRMESDASRTLTGTPRYTAPDIATAGWSRQADVFSLGVILAELLAGHSFGRDGARAWLDSPAAALRPRTRDLLKRATEPDAGARYDSARQFGEDLQAALHELRSLAAQLPEDSFPTADPQDLTDPNRNPYLERLIGLFSQSATSNAGTRGLDDFSRWAYVSTRIDDDLYFRIVEGSFRVVIISGNAGDGKTAFIQMTEARLKAEGATIQSRPAGNGLVARLHGRTLVTNWDGSQVEGERANDDTLVEFFAPFAGPDPDPPSIETRIIAINEGRLLDFLGQHRADFPWLDRVVSDLFEGVDEDVPDWFGMINLNLRVLSLPASGREPSVVSRLIDKFCDRRLWEPCKECRVFNDCYARSNAAALADPTLGPRAAERIRQVIDVVRLRRRLHVTMRDLRSALAYVVAGNRSCDEIAQLVDEGDFRTILAGHVYNALYAASGSAGPDAQAHEAGNDRLLAQVGLVDVAKTANPEDDGRIWSMGPEAIRNDPHGVQRTDREILHDLRDRLPLTADELDEERVRSDIRLIHASLRRKLFLEREEPGWVHMLPFPNLSRFVTQLVGPTTTEKMLVATAISRSEGLHSDTFREALAVRLVEESDTAERSFVTHPVAEFELVVVSRARLARFVEYAPDTLLLRHLTRTDVGLELDLDLYESLQRILAGFTPSREELRGAWLNLRIFKGHLASMPAESLLLLHDDGTTSRIARTTSRDAIVAERVQV
jgi:serine/threonine protein kinase